MPGKEPQLRFNCSWFISAIGFSLTDCSGEHQEFDEGMESCQHISASCC